MMVELCCEGSLLQSANVALPGSSALTVSGSPAAGAAQNIYMVGLCSLICCVPYVECSQLRDWHLFGFKAKVMVFCSYS